jgi:hypothetical protein
VQVQQVYAGPVIAAGTRISAVMDTTIDSRWSRPGDRFSATVLTPLTDTSGRTIMPKGARFVGTVTGAHRGRPFAPTARLNFNVNGAMVHGTYVPLSATLVTTGARVSRGGVFLRPEKRVPAGAVLSVRLSQPVSVATLEQAASGASVGGGPY